MVRLYHVLTWAEKTVHAHSWRQSVWHFQADASSVNGVWIWDSLGRPKIPQICRISFLGQFRMGQISRRLTPSEVRAYQLIPWLNLSCGGCLSGHNWLRDRFHSVSMKISGIFLMLTCYVLPFWYCFRLNQLLRQMQMTIELLMSLQNSFRAHLNRFQLFGVSGNQTWLENLPFFLIFPAFWASTSWIFQLAVFVRGYTF